MVIHCTELPGPGDGARVSASEVLYEARSTGNSGHYYIDRDGSVHQFVAVDRVAHHVRGYNDALDRHRTGQSRPLPGLARRPPPGDERALHARADRSAGRPAAAAAARAARRCATSPATRTWTPPRCPPPTTRTCGSSASSTRVRSFRGRRCCRRFRCSGCRKPRPSSGESRDPGHHEDRPHCPSIALRAWVPAFAGTTVDLGTVARDRILPIHDLLAQPHDFPASEPVVSELIELLSLERLEDNLFRGQSRDIGTKYVFGGQVLGQALSAAQATMERTARARTRCTPTSCAPATSTRRSSTSRPHPRRRQLLGAARHRDPARRADLLHAPPRSRRTKHGGEHQLSMPEVPKPEDIEPAPARAPRT